MGGFESFVFTFNAGLVRAGLLLWAFLEPETLALDCSTRRNSWAAVLRLAGSFTDRFPFLLSFSSLCDGFVLDFWSVWAEAVINPAIANASTTENFICFP